MTLKMVQTMLMMLGLMTKMTFKPCPKEASVMRRQLQHRDQLACSLASKDLVSPAVF